MSSDKDFTEHSSPSTHHSSLVRVRVGRPPEMEERQKVSLYMEAEMLERIRQLAVKRGITVSAMARRLLKRALREKR
jgi:CopG antitoxin of type II toxin-antitoxin system